MKQYKFKINGKEYEVVVNGIKGKNADVSVNGVAYNVELENETPAAVQAQAPVSAPAPVAEATPTTAAPKAGGAGKDIVSPLPGVIISVDVKEGAAVKRGQKVAVIEAMKMENEILADVDGVITAIHVKTGDSVLEDAKIVSIG